MEQETSQAVAPRWKPLSSIERRIAGVLVEKAKTTPDAYPLSLNALVSGCNQKSNRDPHMNLEPPAVEDALERLRQKGVVAEVQGGGRVARYRHYMKDWLGVDGVELAVMTELLLRGAQTIGDLRGRASRMAPIADVAALRPVLAALAAKQLILPLTPAGRGQVVTHNLYEERELERLRQQYGTAGEYSVSGAGDDDELETPEPVVASFAPPLRPASIPPAPAPRPLTGPSSSGVHDSQTLAEMRQEIAALRSEVSGLRKEIEDLWASLRG